VVVINIAQLKGCGGRIDVLMISQGKNYNCHRNQNKTVRHKSPIHMFN
jgi:hypothetical protein